MATRLENIIAGLTQGRMSPVEAAGEIVVLVRGSSGQSSTLESVECVIDEKLPPDIAARVHEALANTAIQSVPPTASENGGSLAQAETLIEKPVSDNKSNDEEPGRSDPDAIREITAADGGTLLVSRQDPKQRNSSEDSPPNTAASSEATIAGPDPGKSLDSVGSSVPSRPLSVASESDAGDSANPQVKPGLLIKNRFVLQEMIGHGGMGEVYSARDLRKVEADDAESQIAIKLLSPDFARHRLALQALQREAKKAQTLSQRNIITVYDFDRDESLIFMTMELLKGRTL